MSYIGEQPIPINAGGTGQTTLPTNGQLLIGDAGAFALANLTAGTNISITNNPGGITIDSTGVPTLTPVFIARLTSTQSTVTGDGTDYTPIIFDTVDNNIGSAYDPSTGLFTAPSGNDYIFAFGITPQGIASDNTLMDFKIETSSGRTAHGFYGNPFVVSYNGQMQIAQQVSITMSTSETAQVSLTVSNGSKVVNVYGDASGNYDTWFAGFLLTGNSGGGGGGGVGVIVDGSGNSVSPIAGVITLVNGNNVFSLSGTPGHITLGVDGTTQYALQVGSAAGALSSLPLGTAGKPLVSAGAGSNPGFTTLGVSGGGTGDATLTANAVLLGEGTSPIGFATVSAAAYALVSNGTGFDPSFQVLGPAGGGTGAGTLTGVVIGNGTSPFTASPVTQYDVLVGDASNAIASVGPGTSGQPLLSGGAAANPAYGDLTVPFGGTGATTLTGVLSGNGTSAITGSAVTQYDVLVGGASNAVSSVGPGTSGQPLLSGGAGANPAYGTLAVPGGGTGATTLTGVLIGNGASAVTGNAVTQHDVLIGGASNAIVSVSPSLSGYVLTSNGVAADPTFQPTSGAGVLTITDGSGNVVSPSGGTITLVNGTSVSSLSGSSSHITLDVANCTQYAVQVGNSAGSLASIGFGTAGQALLSGGNAANPAYGTLAVPAGGTGATSLMDHSVLLGSGTSAISTVGPSASTGLPLISQGAAADPIFATLPVSGGGTGANSLTGVLIGNGTSAVTASAITQYDVLVGGASNEITSVSPSTAGFVLVSNGVSANPTFQAISGIFVNWTDATSATYTLAIQNGYVTDRAGGVNYTLPATANLGDQFKIVGKLGTTTITPNANQQILIGSVSGTVGASGTSVSTNVGDCILMTCVTSGANTVWRASNFVGNWTQN